MTKAPKIDEDAKYRAPALEKGLDIIELLAGHETGMTQSAIAKALNKSQGEIYRMLSTLVRRGYVSRADGSDQYTLSLKLYSTAQQRAPIDRLLEVAQPMMRRMTRKIWQSCHIGMENNASIVVILSVEAPGNWGLSIRTGAVLGLWNSGTGRVIAASLRDEEVNDLIERHQPAVGEPPLDREKFLREIEAVRQLGYYRETSETLYGVTNLSYPIYSPDGTVVAVLTCPYLKRVDGFETASLEEVEHAISETAKALSSYFKGETLNEMDPS